MHSSKVLAALSLAVLVVAFTTAAAACTDTEAPCKSWLGEEPDNACPPLDVFTTNKQPKFRPSTCLNHCALATDRMAADSNGNSGVCGRERPGSVFCGVFPSEWTGCIIGQAFILCCDPKTSSPVVPPTTPPPTPKPTARPTAVPSVSPTFEPTAAPTMFHVFDPLLRGPVDTDDFRAWCDNEVHICPCGTVSNGTHCFPPIAVLDDPTLYDPASPPRPIETLRNYVRCAAAWAELSPERANNYLVQSHSCISSLQNGRGIPVVDRIRVSCTNGKPLWVPYIELLDVTWAEVDTDAMFSKLELDATFTSITWHNGGLESNVSIAAVRVSPEACNNNPGAVRLEIDGLDFHELRDPHDPRYFLVAYHPMLMNTLRSSGIVASGVLSRHGSNATLAEYLMGIAYVAVNAKHVAEFNGVQVSAAPLGTSLSDIYSFLSHNDDLHNLCANVCPCGRWGPSCARRISSAADQVEHSLALARCALLHYEYRFTASNGTFVDALDDVMYAPSPVTGRSALHDLGVLHLPETYLARSLFCVRAVAGPGQGSLYRLSTANEEVAVRGLAQLVEIAAAVLERAPDGTIDSTRVLANVRGAMVALERLTNQNYFAESIYVPKLSLAYFEERVQAVVSSAQHAATRLVVRDSRDTVLNTVGDMIDNLSGNVDDLLKLTADSFANTFTGMAQDAEAEGSLAAAKVQSLYESVTEEVARVQRAVDRSMQWMEALNATVPKLLEFSDILVNVTAKYNKAVDEARSARELASKILNIAMVVRCHSRPGL